MFSLAFPSWPLPSFLVRILKTIRVVTGYVGSGIRRVGSAITSHQRSGSAVFLGIRDQAVILLWDQGSKFASLLESRIRKLVTKMGSAMKKHTSLRS